MKTRHLNNNCHCEHYDIKHMFSYTIGEKPVIFTYPDVPSELNKFGKCLTTEISGMPYFSEQKTFLSNHVDHLHNREWCISQANDCNLILKQNTHLGKLKFMRLVLIVFVFCLKTRQSSCDIESN